MTVSYNEIPAANLTPFFYVEVDNSGAVQGSLDIPWKNLLIGQQLAAKSAPKAVTLITSLGQARALFGAGSQLANMIEAFLASNSVQPLYVLPLSDASGSAAATCTLTLTGNATANGELDLLIGGRHVAVGVLTGDTPTIQAAAVAAAVQAAGDLPVSATALAGVVTFTAKNKGLAGNEIDLRLNYYQGEALPAGTTAALTAMSGGTLDPDLSTEGVAGLIASYWFQAIAMPYSGAANVATMEAEMALRWKANSQTGGVVYVAKNVAFSSLTTYGDGRNSPFTVALNAENVPTTPCELAAELAALAALSASIDPARPLQTLTFANAKAPSRAQENSYTENETLLQKGIATFTVGEDRKLRIQRVVTTYKTNTTGSPDASYRDVETVHTLQAIRYDWAAYMRSKYPRHKLANDGTNFGPGQPVITPKTGRAEAIGRFQLWEERGWVEGFAQFKEALVVERNSGDVNRLDFLLRPNLVNQFRIGATQVRFIL